MPRPTKPTFITITCEGALFPLDFLRKIADRDPSLEGVSEGTYHIIDEKLNEVINASWMHLLQRWRTFGRSDVNRIKEQWFYPLFAELGYGRLPTTKPFEVDGKRYSISHHWGYVPIHLAGIERRLDEHFYRVKGSATFQSPHVLVQELLNHSSEHIWGMVTNGLQLRLLRRNKRLMHRTYIEFDLEAMMEGEVYADFVLFWLLCHQSRFESEHPEECWLEQWLRTAYEQGIRALDKLRLGVEGAIQLLGQGFLECRTNQQLQEKLRSGILETKDYYRQLLRLVYRIIVLFVAEDRGLLLIPDADEQAKERYLKYYSMTRLRHLARRRYGSPHTDLFQCLTVIMHKLSQDPGCPELALPTLDGFLFEQDALRDLERCEITNASLLAALRSLAFLPQDDGLLPVDYQHIGSEELGSVYEAFLELSAVIDKDSLKFSLQMNSSNDRKSSGSYYTPRELVESLLDLTLEPVLTKACQQADAANAILTIKVCDPACGSGHFLIAAAQRMAYRLAFERAGGIEPDREMWGKALREVIRHCIYGVDSNSMAVELCKVSLCIEAIEPGKPLVFLDNHIRCGDSLIGTTPALLQQGIPESAFKSVGGDVAQLNRIYRRRNKEGHAGQWHLLLEPMEYITSQLEQLHGQDDSSYEKIQVIEQCYRELTTRREYKRNMLIANAWCAAFFWRKAYIDADNLAYPLTQGILRELIENQHLYHDMVDEIERLASLYQFFHWHLSFPDVFSAPTDQEPEIDVPHRSGGFDVVLGNPPYVFGENHDQRKKVFLQTAFHLAKGQYDTYWLFIEQGLKLIKPGGRLAFIVPDALLARDETRYAREMLLKSGLEYIYDCGTAFKASISTIIFAVVNGSTSHDIIGKMLHGSGEYTTYRHSRERFLSDPKYKLLVHIPDEEALVFNRIENACLPLEHFVRISRGEEIGKKSISPDGTIPIVVGEDISRYSIKQPSRFLQAFKKNYSLYQSPKLVLMKTGYRCIASLDDVGYVTMQSVYNLHITRGEISYEALLALLNSRFVHCFIYKNFTSYKNIFPQLNQSTVQAIPVPSGLFAAQEELQSQVWCIQRLSKELEFAVGEPQKKLLEAQIASIDKKIDLVIYDLYGLTTEEIHLIERGVR